MKGLELSSARGITGLTARRTERGGREECDTDKKREKIAETHGRRHNHKLPKYLIPCSVSLASFVITVLYHLPPFFLALCLHLHPYPSQQCRLFDVTRSLPCVGSLPRSVGDTPLHITTPSTTFESTATRRSSTRVSPENRERTCYLLTIPNFGLLLVR